MDREGRWEAEADRQTLLRGQDCPASGGNDSGGHLRAGVSWVLPWLQRRAQSTPSAARTARAVSDVAYCLDSGWPGQQSDAPSGVSPAWLAIGRSFWLPRNRMRETFTSGGVSSEGWRVQ